MASHRNLMLWLACSHLLASSFLPPPGFVMQLLLLQAKREPDSWELVVWARRGMDGQAVLPVAMPAGRVF